MDCAGTVETNLASRNSSDFPFLLVELLSPHNQSRIVSPIPKVFRVAATGSEHNQRTEVGNKHSRWLKGRRMFPPLGSMNKILDSRGPGGVGRRRRISMSRSRC